MPEVLSVDKVLRIAAAGDPFTLNGAGVPLTDLLAIATAARCSKGLVRFRGMTGRPLEELMQITVASQGRVIIEDDEPAPKPRGRRSWLPLPRRPSPSRTAPVPTAIQAGQNRAVHA